MTATKKKSRYVLCIRNEGHEVSLAPRKVYEVIPDPLGEKYLMVRVIDETDEDYLFPVSYFVPIDLPEAARRLFSSEPAAPNNEPARGEEHPGRRELAIKRLIDR